MVTEVALVGAGAREPALSGVDGEVGVLQVDGEVLQIVALREEGGELRQQIHVSTPGFTQDVRLQDLVPVDGDGEGGDLLQHVLRDHFGDVAEAEEAVGEGDALLGEQADAFAEDLAVDEEDGGGGFVAFEDSGFLVWGSLADALVVAVEVLLDALRVDAQLVDHVAQLWWEAEEGECLADLQLLEPREDLSVAVQVDGARGGL